MQRKIILLLIIAVVTFGLVSFVLVVRDGMISDFAARKISLSF